jgi:hypothetical protein
MSKNTLTDFDLAPFEIIDGGGRNGNLVVVKIAAVENGNLTSKPQNTARPSSCLCYAISFFHCGA